MDKNEIYLAEGPKWSWWELFLVILWLISLMAFVAMFKHPIRDFVIKMGVEQENLQTVLLFISSVLQASVLVIAVTVIIYRRGAAFRDLGFNKNNLTRHVIIGLIGGLFLVCLVWFIGLIYTLIAGPPPPQEAEKLLTGVKTGRDMLLPFIAIAVLAPISEEIYFRAMVYPVFKARFGPLRAMFMSGVFFSSLHLDIYRLIPIAAGGAGLAYLYEKTDSIVTPVIAHATWNSLMLISYYLLTVD